uniref:EF-hand calcium-binding domain-containing protein 6-like n=1 Tax=Callorhinchus milii TaxID=7868 RepID=A0A4W3IXV4_CALMI|eukprot:gi/632971915/ref/XP_007902403.1/ PREDICTED: EF-hand calcium-binding domain-containing protein 6-like [Callorhinchus milii]
MKPLIFRQVLNNFCFRLTDKQFSHLISTLKLHPYCTVDWLDFLRNFNIYSYKASEAWEEKLGTPKLAPHVTIDDILTRVREVVTSRLHVINREFAEIDYANLKVVSKQHFKEIFCKYFMHLTEEQVGSESGRTRDAQHRNSRQPLSQFLHTLTALCLECSSGVSLPPR